ncbi:MAG: efflux RND transporter permease subunit [Bacillota bacterium]
MNVVMKTKGRAIILIIVGLLIVISFFLLPNVTTNYDMTEYLSENSMTQEGMDVLEESFGNHATIQVMVEDIELTQVLSKKSLIENVDGVMDVIWLDDVIDIENIASADPMTVGAYYQNSIALYTIVFNEDNYALSIEDSIHEIETLFTGFTVSMRGDALDNIESREIAEGEVVALMLIILPVAIIILIIASKSWFESILILFALGVAVLFNMASNAFLPHVSFITLTIAAALQLAISLDYSLFLLHRYDEYKTAGDSVYTAMQKALKKVFPTITASALTTIVGFLSLLFMQFKIGFDIGIVLSKGIVFSYLSVLFLLPVLIIIFSSLLDKTRHKAFFFDVAFLAKPLIKIRYLLFVLLVALAGVGFYYQNQAGFLFGASEYLDEESDVYQEQESIQSYFGVYQPIIILVEEQNLPKELTVIQEVSALDKTLQVDSLATQVDPDTPLMMIPDTIKLNFIQNDISRINVYTNIEREGETMFSYYESLDAIVSSEYDTYYVLGIVPSTYEIRETVLEDTPVVVFVSVIAIAIILAIIFRNLFIPILLLVVIEASIWLNVGFLGIFDTKVVYIGYLVVLALQLGATIDYAVLLSSRYREIRETYDKKEAVYYALKRASIPIMISGVILASAGFSEAIYSNLSAVTDIGLLIGRGALLSMAFVLVFLPALLFVFDRWIIKHIR